MIFLTTVNPILSFDLQMLTNAPKIMEIAVNSALTILVDFVVLALGVSSW